MGIDHLISRRPQATQCPRCLRIMLVGIDEGVPFKVEPVPLTVSAEIKARMEGRKTFSTSAGYVAHRSASRMKSDLKYGRPAVFATHNCKTVPAPEEIQMSQVDATTRMMAGRKKKMGKQTPELMQDYEALFTISDMLAGRIIAIQSFGEPAPF